MCNLKFKIKENLCIYTKHNSNRLLLDEFLEYSELGNVLEFAGKQQLVHKDLLLVFDHQCVTSDVNLELLYL